jgi:hypothetical protein
VYEDFSGDWKGADPGLPLPKWAQSEYAKIQAIRGNGGLAEGDRVIEFPHVLSYPGTRLIQS